jgi:hypothetical protein
VPATSTLTLSPPRPSTPPDNCKRSPISHSRRKLNSSAVAHNFSPITDANEAPPYPHPGTFYYAFAVACFVLLFWSAPINAIVFASLFVGDGNKSNSSLMNDDVRLVQGGHVLRYSKQAYPFIHTLCSVFASQTGSDALERLL